MTRRVALVGTGLVGASWIVVFARAGWQVAAYDAHVAQLDAARAQAASALAACESAGLLRENPDVILERVRFESSLERALDGASYVQESASERLDLKRALYATLDAAAPPEAILASSTSSFPTSAFAAGLAGAARCLVAHPVNPPHLIPFVEVSGAPFTSEAALSSTLAILEAVGQSPIRVRREVEGFVLNRLQWALLAEALHLVEEGVVSADDVDRALADGLGRRWAFIGPFAVGDLNAPDGLRDYLARFGPTIAGIARSRGARPPGLDAASGEAVHRQLSRDGSLDDRRRARDRALLELAALRRRLGGDA